jgi:hypothetical protein
MQTTVLNKSSETTVLNENRIFIFCGSECTIFHCNKTH